MRSNRRRRRITGWNSSALIRRSGESLETRTLLSATIQNLANINQTNPWAAVHEIEEVGSLVFFVASEHNSTTVDLWRSDGTTSGTIRLANLGPKDTGLHHLTNVNGTLFFQGYDSLEGHELWKTDGTLSGTSLVRALRSGVAGPTLSDFTSFRGSLFFTADGHLCRSNGTSAGTFRVKDLFPGISDQASRFEVIGDTLFFTAKSSGEGFDLYRSNGVGTGTVRVTSVPSGILTDLTRVGASLFFVRNQNELWRFSADLQTANLIRSFDSGLELRELTDVNGTLFFSNNVNEILTSNGTPEGTISVRYIGDAVNNLYSWNGALYFSGGLYYLGNGEELWRSDGTTSGTVQLRDINTNFNEGYGFGSYPQGFTEFDGQLYFLAQGLWKTDGTTDGTVSVDPSASGFLRNANGNLFYFSPHSGGLKLRLLSDSELDSVDVPRKGSGTGHSNPTTPVLHNGSLFFAADDGVSGQELRRRNSDGTIELVADLTPGPDGTQIERMISLNGLLYFEASNKIFGRSLWRSDGSSTGTIKLAEVIRAPGSTTEPLMVAVNNLVYFAGSSSSGVELWRTDGTVAGTALVKDINPGVTNTDYGVYPRSSSPASLTNVNGTLFFSAFDTANGRELWKSNGTAQGTVLVEDLFPGSQQYYPYEAYSSSPTAFTNRNGVLHFVARDHSGFRFWTSTGEPVGTHAISSVISGLQSISSVLNVNDRLFFVGSNTSIAQELWTSDWTTAGTVLLRDIRPGSYPSHISNLTEMDGTLFFTADDGVHGKELWRSNGTTTGTAMVRDIRTDFEQDRPGSSNPRELTPLNGVLYFTADDGKNGLELWRTNGSASGATRMPELVAGPGSTGPRGLASWNNSLLYSGSSSLGRELWQVRSAAPTLTFSPAYATFTEGQNSVSVVPDAVLQDVDTPVLVGGQLTATILNPKSGDEVRLADSFFIDQVGSSIQYLKIGIGTAVLNANKSTLTIKLNLNATVSRVQELIRTIAFFNSSESPGSVRRFMRLTLTDGEGGKFMRSRGVQVVPVNDPPVLVIPATLSYERNNPTGVSLASSGMATDVDSFGLNGGQLQISVTGGDAQTNRVFLSGTAFSIETTGHLSQSGVVIGSLNLNAGVGLSSFRVTFNANARMSHVQLLLRSLRFATSASSSNQDRQVSILLDDGDGGLGTVVSNVVVRITS